MKLTGSEVRAARHTAFEGVWIAGFPQDDFRPRNNFRIACPSATIRRAGKPTPI